MQVKSHVKQFLIRSRLWHQINLLKGTPGIFRWLRSGCRGVAPHSIKIVALRSYLNRFSLEQFVETGTYLGDTLDYIAALGIQCTSIELSLELHKAAIARFRWRKNVRLVQGDSAQELPKLLVQIDKPTLFWLDGHYSEGITACAETHTPVSAELKALLRHPIKRHVILIDDARCFEGSNGYPHLDSLLREIREEGSYSAEVSTDIIRLVPRPGT